MIQITGKGIDFDWKSWKLISPSHAFFFFQYQKIVSHKLNTVKLQCNYNPLLVYYLISISIKLEFSFKLSALSLFFFVYFGSHDRAASHRKFQSEERCKICGVNLLRKHASLLFPLRTITKCSEFTAITPSFTQSVFTTTLQHLLAKSRPQGLSSSRPKKRAGDGKRTGRRERERKIKGNVLSTFHDWHHNFVLDITSTSTSFF